MDSSSRAADSGSAGGADGGESPISALYATVAEWAVLKGANNLPATPGLWNGELGEFRISINAHREEHVSPDGMTVPPMHVLINAPKYFFAGILCHPYGGIGAADIEADVMAALEADIAKAATPLAAPDQQVEREDSREANQ